MSETDMRAKLARVLSPLHGIAVENPALPGTPDVNYIEGWIEAKWLREWPVGADTPVRFDHYTPQQRSFAIKRRLAGGRCWLMIQCRREWLLLDGVVAALYLNFTPKAGLIEVAAKYWSRGLNQKELIRCVTVRQNDFSLTGEDGERLRKMLRAGTGSNTTGTADGSEA